MSAESSNGSSSPLRRIAVLGAGSFGTALVQSLATGGHDVSLWSRRRDLAERIQETRHNHDYLPKAKLPPSVSISSDIAEVVAGRDLWIVAVPSQSVREVATSLAPHATEAHTIVSVAKGIENGTLLTTTGVLREVLPHANPNRIGVLYGPSHAEELAARQPTSIVLTIPDLTTAEQVQEVFMSSYLRVYVNPDLIGVEIGGSVKNVLALAAGMADGLGYGDNAKAALITRGLVEMQRLGVAMGADPHTFAGLAGFGDLVVTCFSQHSRNRYLGEQIGRGTSLEDAQAEMRMVAEGVRTTQSTYALAQRHGVEMPITEAVYAILFENLAPRDAVLELMTRDARAEIEAHD
ncbi:NAD(P)H-dependent glycerol-3-phosphate dehydrogenase [soil metagenome]